jgi:hypothetical protein
MFVMYVCFLFIIHNLTLRPTSQPKGRRILVIRFVIKNKITRISKHKMPSNHVLSFEAIDIERNADAFNGVFLTQESYIHLLRIADSLFNLNMCSSTRQLPCLRNSYMIMSRSNNQLLHGIGKKASLTINKMLYNSHFGVLAAMVHLKKNFTCNAVPHIVIARRDAGINNAIISRIMNGEGSDEFPSQVEILYTPIKVHGKVGIMIGVEEVLQSDTKYIDGVKVHTTQHIVTRPEVTYSVENPLPPKPPKEKFLSFDQFKAQTRVAAPLISTSGENLDTMKITIDGPAERTRGKVVHTGEYYRGAPVMKGPRGGKFIIKDEKKLYVTDADMAGESDEVLYKVNVLKDA